MTSFGVQIGHSSLARGLPRSGACSLGCGCAAGVVDCWRALESCPADVRHLHWWRRPAGLVAVWRMSAAAVALTGRAMLDAHSGQPDDARSAVTAALNWYDTSPLRFDRARTLLIAGQISRRAKAKSDARDLLTEAENEFASFGAMAWRGQAAAELARVNVRPSAPSDLTETERLVAQLAASGLSNREVADRTFLAVKTVEANLARAYRKLGISSRAELGARMGATGR